MTDEARLSALKLSLRIWGIMGYIIFVPLMIGFAVQAPIIDTGGWLNWSIWNGVTCGAEPCHVPPMIFIIYITWATFALIAARDPARNRSFLQFTMWANFAHAGLMSLQAIAMGGILWTKFLTDIPYVAMISVAILVYRPARAADRLEVSA